MKFVLYILATFNLVFSTYGQVSAEEWGNMHISYIREVENQLFLSDFQLGSDIFTFETWFQLEGTGTSDLLSIGDYRASYGAALEFVDGDGDYWYSHDVVFDSNSNKVVLM